jgi:hypothetical protein
MFIVGAVNNTHTTCTKRRHETVVPESLSDRWGLCCHRVLMLG